MVEDRDSPPPYQGESRSRPSNQSSHVMVAGREPVWWWTVGRSGTIQWVYWLRTVAVQWLSPMLICPIRCTDRTPTDLVKPRQPQPVWTSVEPVESR